ncbi:MAG: type II toxin-antitoxin system VapC family toxin [Bdellovibrio sp.]|nr:type II toxin-antitoxin system VapC family toxin [Bdellovibrio sp.]
MIYIDSCIPMYLVGAQHRNKSRVIEMISSLLSARETLVTSAEAFQEILHRYKAIHNPKHMKIAYEALDELAFSVEPICKEDTDRALTLCFQLPSLSSRDCLHLAVMNRIGCRRIWTYDANFDGIPKIDRVY